MTWISSWHRNPCSLVRFAGINAGQLVLPAQNFQLKFHKQPTAATFDASGGSQAQMVVSPVAQGVVPKTDEQPAVQPTFEEIYPNL